MGTAECKIETQRSKPPPWVRRIQGSINDIRKELSVLVEIKRDNRMVQYIKRSRMLKKYNIEKGEDLNRLIEEQNVSEKPQQLSRYRERQNQYYQNKLFATDCKKFYNRLRQTEGNVKNAPDKEELENFWREIYENKVKHNGEECWIKQKPVPTKSKHGMEPHM